MGEDEGHVTQEVGLRARTGPWQIVLSFGGKEWETILYRGEGNDGGYGRKAFGGLVGASVWLELTVSAGGK